jgi:glyoxylase-like metal-dependent hydrolase (beta-lactamase superfamily II)
MQTPRIPNHAFPMEIAPGTFILGNYYFNLFLVAGSEKTALFETGVSAGVDQVIGQLDALGICPDFLVVSHPHTDHITGLPGLKACYPQAQVLAAQGAVEFITHPKAEPGLIKEDRFISSSLMASGITPGRPSLESVPDLSGHTVVRESLDLDLGGGTCLTLMPVDGHSPGNLIAWEKEKNILLCSDSLGFHYPGRGFWPLFFTSARSYIDTMDMMADLDPDILCPAHHGPIQDKDVPAALALARQTTTDLINRVVQETGDDQALANDLFAESYKDEFTLYTRSNILNCNRLLIKRARETQG